MTDLFDGPIEQVAELFQERFLPSETMALQFGDCPIRVVSNSADLIAELQRYFRGFTIVPTNRVEMEVTALEGPMVEAGGQFLIKPPEPGKTRIKEEFREISGGRIVKKRLTGMLFVFGRGINLALGPCLDNTNQVINFINNRYIQWMLDRGCLLFHAAGVCVDQTGLALAGFAGRGKSSLALRMVREGWRFVSNDRLLVSREGKKLSMYGVAKLPRVNPGTLLADPVLEGVLSEADRRRYAGIPRDHLWELEHKHDVSLDELFGKDIFLLEAPLSALVLLNWKKHLHVPRFTAVDLRERKDLMRTFVKSPGLFYQPDPDQPKPDFSGKRYLEMLQDVPVYEVTEGVDFDQAAEFAASLREE